MVSTIIWIAVFVASDLAFSQEGTSPMGIQLRVSDSEKSELPSQGTIDGASYTEFLYEIPIPSELWRHICFEYNREDENIYFTLDGENEMLSYKKVVIEKRSQLPLRGDAFLCLGNERFEGDIVNLRVWVNSFGNIPLNEASGRDSQVDQPSFINFSHRWALSIGQTIKTFDKATLCEVSEQIVIIDPAGAYFETYALCRSMGGQFLTDVKAQTYVTTSLEFVNNSCQNENGIVSWVSQPTNSDSQESFTLECLAIDCKSDIVPVACVRRLPISICQVKLERYTLYGHEGKYFDYIYYMNTHQDGRPYLKGIGDSMIAKEDDAWVLSSLLHKSKWTLKNVILPIGRHTWTTSDFHSQIVLSFAKCTSSQFACNDGMCIDILKRCDDVLNCQDRSDEEDCEALEMPYGYDPLNIPPPRENEVLPLDLLYHVDVYNLDDVTTEEGVASMDLGITMKWFDPRIKLQNLKPIKKNYFACPKVWVPIVTAVSGDGQGSILDTNQYEKFCFVFSNNQTTERNLADPYMGHSTSGSSSPIIHYLGLLASVPCSFSLYMYPFDAQRCNISFKVMNAPGNRVYKKELEGNDVPYLNARTILLEYELLALTTQTGYIMKGSDNDTYFSITFHLQRLYGYHITNSFFPTILMTIISYSTYYFQIDDFTNRIMISLTAQLVLASLFTSTTASSVKTPYLKMIDVWYAAIITFCFLIIVTQVYINVLYNSREEHRILSKILGIEKKESSDPEKGEFNGSLAAKKINKLSSIIIAIIVFVFILIYSLLTLRGF